ncbi:MAG: glycosyltransferase family 39 protein [Bacteroidetes bacterium]|nr:glycosyltransferase family 39 protein [Bacteroidota bacterium]
MIKYIKENKEKSFLFLILIIGTFLRLYNINGLSLSNEEFSAIARAQSGNFQEYLSNEIYNDVYPAGIEFFLYLWIKVFGTSVIMLRLPFVAVGVLSIYFAYKVSARWFNEYSGLFVAAAMCFLEFPLLYSQLAQPFIPGLLFSMLTAWFLTKMVFENKTERKNIIALALSFSLAAYFHYFALVFNGIMVISFVFFINKDNFKAYLLSIILAIILYIPGIIVLIYHLGSPLAANWLTEPENKAFFEHIFFIFNKSQFLLYTFFAILIITNINSFTDIKFSKFHVLALSLFLIPFFGAFYYSLWAKPILENSMLLFSFPFLLFFLFSFTRINDKKFNFSALGVLLLIGIFSTVAEKKYYNTYHFSEFKEIAKKTIEYNNQFGDKNITRVININSPYYINYYLEKFDNPLPFALYRNEGKNDFYKLNKLVQRNQTKYFLYAWSGVFNPPETKDIIMTKYPYIIEDIDYNGMAGISLYSSTDKKKTIPQAKPVFYVFNGFEDKQTWDKDTSILTTEKVCYGKYAVKLDAQNEYGPAYVSRISKMTDKIFKRVNVSLWSFAAGNFKDAQIVATINFKDDENQVYENYFWLSSKFEYFIDKNKWGQVFFSFNLPELRSKNDELKIYVWNPDKQPLYIDNFELKLFEK